MRPAARSVSCCDAHTRLMKPPMLLLLQPFVCCLQGKQGQPVPVLILRHGQLSTVQVTPQPWSGRGLLGCHLRPL